MTVTFSKGEDSKRRVLAAAMELFLEQGYEKTTMRQIVQKSGVLNGSVYHAFKNKEGVFEEVYKIIAVKFSNTLNRDEPDAQIALMYPVAMMLKYCSTDPRATDLMHAAFASWTIFKLMVDHYSNYVNDICVKRGWTVDTYRIHGMCSAIMATMAVSVHEHYHDDVSDTIEARLQLELEYVCSCLRLPLMDPEAAVDRIFATVPDCKDLLKDLLL